MNANIAGRSDDPAITVQQAWCYWHRWVKISRCYLHGWWTLALQVGPLIPRYLSGYLSTSWCCCHRWVKISRCYEPGWWMLVLLVGLVIPLYLFKTPGANDTGEWRNPGAVNTVSPLLPCGRSDDPAILSINPGAVDTGEWRNPCVIYLGDGC